MNLLPDCKLPSSAWMRPLIHLPKRICVFLSSHPHVFWYSQNTLTTFRCLIVIVPLTPLFPPLPLFAQSLPQFLLVAFVGTIVNANALSMLLEIYIVSIIRKTENRRMTTKDGTRTIQSRDSNYYSFHW